MFSGRDFEQLLHGSSGIIPMSLEGNYWARPWYRRLFDGVYFVDDSIVVKELNPWADEIEKEVREFYATYGDVYVAQAYEVEEIVFLLSRRPKQIEAWEGSGFNYGACAMVRVEAPGRVLIIAEND